MGLFALKANKTHRNRTGAAEAAILVALGANLPGHDGTTPMQSCRRALDLMAGRGIAVLRCSRWFSSAPVPEADQPDFVNGVVQVASALDPDALLAGLHEIEDRLGRVRNSANAARIIDLDLIAHGRTRRGGGGGASGGGSGGGVGGDAANGGLVLPHPRLHERAFVLLPMVDLVPDWRHPVSGASLASLIAALAPGQRCTPLE